MPPESALERAVEAERVLALDMTYVDDTLRYALLVDEPLPPDLAARTTRLQADVLLRAAAGRLRYGGIEELERPGEEPGATVLELPPGDYLVEVLRTTFDDKDLLAALRAHPETAGDLRREERARSHGCVCLVVGLLVCVLGLALGLRAGGGVSVWGQPTPAATPALLGAGAAFTVGLLAIGVGVATLKLLLPGEAFRKRREAHQARLPEVVLPLRSAPPVHDRRGARVELEFSPS